MSLLEQELQQPRPFDDPATEAILSVLKSGDVIERELDQAVAAFGLTLQQYNVLMALRRGGARGIPVLDIADNLIEDCPNVTRLLDRLVAKGLAERRRADHDRRVVYARLTAAGETVVESLRAPVHQARRSICGTLSGTEMDTLTRLLEKIRRSVYSHRQA